MLKETTMEWLGFGKGFGFSLDDITNNTWTEAARKASIEARKMSKAAHKATILAIGKLHPSKAWGNRSWGYSKTGVGIAQSAIDAMKEGSKTPLPQIHISATESHNRAAKSHEETMGETQGDQAKLHKEAAIAHRKAAEAHTKAEEAHIESKIMEQDKGADDIAHIHRPLD